MPGSPAPSTQPKHDWQPCARRRCHAKFYCCETSTPLLMSYSFLFIPSTITVPRHTLEAAFFIPFVAMKLYRPRWFAVGAGKVWQEFKIKQVFFTALFASLLSSLPLVEAHMNRRCFWLASSLLGTCCGAGNQEKWWRNQIGVWKVS